MPALESHFRRFLISIAVLAFGVLLPATDARANCLADPAGFNVVSHDLASSYCELCGIGQIRIVVSNPDTQQLTDLDIVEDLSASGLEYVTGSTIFNGVPMPAAEPTIVASVLTWTTTEIPALATLAGGANHVLVFQVRATTAGASTPEDLVTAGRLIDASASFDFANCPTPPFPPSLPWPRTTDSTGAQTITLREPEPGITKLGRNIDASQGAYATAVFGNDEDDVIWQVTIANTGAADMQDLKFSDLMGAGSMTINYACPTEADALTIANNDGGGPIPADCVNASNNIPDFEVWDPFGNPGNDEAGGGVVDIPATGVANVYLVGKLANPCGNQTNTAGSVEWGCRGTGAAGGIATSASGVTVAPSSATLSSVVTNGNLDVQRQYFGVNDTIPSLGSRGRVIITITNNTGGTVRSVKLNNILPTEYEIDETFAPTIVTTSAYGAYPGMTDFIVRDNPANSAAPQFSLTSNGDVHPDHPEQFDMLRNGDQVVVTFHVVMVQSAYFDQVAELELPLENPGDSTDPDSNQPVSTDNDLTVTFEPFCDVIDASPIASPATLNFLDTPQIDPEDLDITLSSPLYIITNDPLFPVPLTVNLTNSGGHTAADYTVYVTFGEAMEVQPASVPAGCVISANPPPRPVWPLPTGVPPPIPATAEVYECSDSNPGLNPIGPGNTISLTFDVTKRIPAVTDDLMFRADVIGEITLNDGTPLTYPVAPDPIGSAANNYSLDATRSRVLGFNLLKTQIANCTEDNPPPVSNDNVIIGEQCTFNIESGGWFGFQTPGFNFIAVENVLVTDQMPDGQGFLSEDTSASTGGISAPVVNGGTPPNPLDEGDITWLFNPTGDEITVRDEFFRAEIVTRMLNDQIDVSAAPNFHAQTSRNIAVTQFDAVFDTTTITVDQNTGVPGYPVEAVRRIDKVVTEPNIQVLKQVCNETLDGVGLACSDWQTTRDDGDTNDSYIYRIRLTNQASSGGVARAPAYNIVSTDTLDASDLILVVPFGGDGLDNDGDGLIDGLDPDGEGTIFDPDGVGGGTPAVITFSHTHSSALQQINPGVANRVWFYYRVDPDDDVAPLQALINTVTMTYDSLVNDSGNQTAPLGNNSEIGGARVYTTTPEQATVRILPLITQPKAITALSNTAASAQPQPVSIGEEVEYQLTTEIPVSRLRSFVIRDELPAGMRCIEAPDINLSAGIYAPAGFVPGGTITPTCTNTGTNDFVEWNFGDQELTTAGGTRFNFPVSFIARFENTAINNDTDVVSNGAPSTVATVSYIDSGNNPVSLNFASNSALVSEPVIALTKAFSVANTDAGDVLTVTVTATNTGTATAYNLRVLDNLVGTKMTYDNVGPDPPDNVDTSVANRPIFSWNTGSAEYAIAPGATIDFNFTIIVDIDVEPEEVLSNTLQASWQSLPGQNTALNATGLIGANGTDIGMRNGEVPNANDAINDYETTATDTVTVWPAGIGKARLSDTYGAGPEVRIGDIVEYELRLTLPEGTTNSIVLSDVLPQGLQYESTVSVNGDTIAPYVAVPPFTHVDFAGAGVAGDATAGPTTVTWNLGQVINADDNNAGNNDFVIIYRARVLNLVHPQAANIALTNTVSFDYVAGGVAAPTQNTNETIDLVQPDLTVSKTAAPADGDTVLDANEIVTYTVDIINTSTAPAYDTLLQDVIPVGLRNGAVTITVTSISLLSGPVLPDLAPTYDASTGVAVWNFDTGVADQYTIPAGDTLRLVYQVQADPDLSASMIMINQAQVQNYYSFDDEAVPTLGGINGVREIYGPSNTDSVTLTTQDPNPLAKLNPALPEITIGETFSYRIRVPSTAQQIALHDVVILDNLTTSAAVLEFVSVTRVSGSQTWTPVNTSTTLNELEIEDEVNGIDIPAGEQIEIDITVRLVDTTPTNVAGVLFTNTADYKFNQIDDDGTTQADGADDTTPPITIVEPDLTMDKIGPPSVQFGLPSTYTLDLENTGTSRAWDITIIDQLPNQVNAGMCDTPPTVLTVQVFLNDGVTPVSPVLVEGTDFITSFTPPPPPGPASVCTLTLTMQTPAAAVDPTQRLIVTYEATPDNDNLEGAPLTNVAGATQWFSLDTADPGISVDTRTYNRVLTDGSLTHEDAVTIASEVPVLEFRKTVVNLNTGQDPGSNASPGDTLHYTITVRNLSNITLADFSLTDEVDRLSGGTALFVPGSLTNLVVVGGTGANDTSNTDANGGTQGTGLVDIRNIGLDATGGANDNLTITFDITLIPVIPNGTLALNQAQIFIPNYVTLDSDDPNVNGPDDPVIIGDEDPTRTVIGSAPIMQVQKVSQDLTGDPAILEPGDTLRYTITVKNIGNENSINTSLRDQIPANTTYVANSTTLNGTLVADIAGVSALQNGFLINAPEDITPGFMRADVDIAANNVATITFDVTVDGSVINGTTISNQGFVNGTGSSGGAYPEQPSDDPATPAVDDPTVDVVGNVPLITAQKTVQILNDVVNPGILDTGESIRYTITVTNTGAVDATNVVLTDGIPAGTTYDLGTVTLNGIAVPDAAGPQSPLVGGMPISSSDLTPPLPTVGNGTLSVGGTATITFDVTVTAAAGAIISNQGTVTSNEQPPELTDADGDGSNGNQPTLIVVGSGQQLAITKAVSVVGGGVVVAGGELEYVVQVTNFGSVPASDVVITDNLDLPVAGQITYVPGSATLDGAVAGVSYAAPIITADYGATYGDLAPGATTTLRFRVTINGALPIGTTITNNADVTWNAGTQNNTAGVSVDVGGTPGFANLNGSAWHDADFDNAIGAAERRLQNWTVEFYRNATLVGSVLTDANGVYQINGIAPNDVSGDLYELRFVAPSAGATTASLGLTDSVFTDGQQAITTIIVGSGSNAQNLNLPIDPGGVVYDSVSRLPIAGATLTMSRVGVDLAASCFDDTVQQDQVTLADGYYKFDLNFSAGCGNPGDDYVIRVTSPGPAYSNTPSLVIPPITDGATPPYSVQLCPSDAMPAPLGFCEAQASEFAPSLAVPPATPGTNHYLHLTLDNPQPGNSQIFNDHIPLDPVITGTGVTLTKTSPFTNVTRGQLVPYTITAINNLGGTLADNDIVDTIPPGFKYVAGSATLAGAKVEPTITGRELRWSTVPLPAGTSVTLKMILVVGSGVGEGEYVNQVYVFNNTLGTNASGVTSATVRVVADPTFDCSDVIGKVFNDLNGNGYQDEGEPGLPGARVVTTKGLLIDSDKHGRYHITCAAVPNPDRGSNFILKLDTRSLPSGYRMTSENPRVVRLTRGKMGKINFGATIHRVVRLDISDAAFESVKSTLRPEWREAINEVVNQLKEGPSVLRLSYLGDAESNAMAKGRIENVRKILLAQWQKLDLDFELSIETELFWRRGRPGEGGGAGRWNGTSFSSLDANVLVSDIGENTEYILPDANFTVWASDEDKFELTDSDRVFFESREIEDVNVTSVPERVNAISTVSGSPDVSPGTISRLKVLLREVGQNKRLRMHFTGHVEDKESVETGQSPTEDPVAASKAQAKLTAEYFMQELNLGAEQVTFEGKGSSVPVSGNVTTTGDVVNRRVDVRLWLEEVSERTINEPEIIPPAGVKKLQVCRREPACIVVRKTKDARKVVVRRPIDAIRFTNNSLRVAEVDIAQLRTVVARYRDKPNWQLRVTGHIDAAPISRDAVALYGNKQGLSRAHARVVAEQIRRALELEDHQVVYEGAGDSAPLADNNSVRGRELNRRIEVSLWFDAPEDVLSVSGPQLCPVDADGRDHIAERYQPDGQDPIGAVDYKNGKPVINEQYLVQLKGLLERLKDKRNLRIVFAGYTESTLLNRRGAQAYGDNRGLSEARAHTVRDAIQEALNLPSGMLSFEGKGISESTAIDQGRVLQSPGGYVDLEIWFDVPAPRDENVIAELIRVQRNTNPVNPFNLAPLRVTVDGKRLDGSLPHSADVQRCTDVALNKTDIQLSFDGNKVQPRLKLVAAPTTITREDDAETPQRENEVIFSGFTNYPAMIEKAEVRLFRSAQSLDDKPHAIIAMDEKLQGKWQAKWDSDAEYKYVLRVYDEAGRFDETQANRLWVVKQSALLAKTSSGDSSLSDRAFGESSLARRGIPMDGGSITVNAKAVPPGHQVRIMNRPVPVDSNGQMVSQQIIPKGLHTVEVAVLDPVGNGQVYLRDLGMTHSNWFYTGIADVTMGMDNTSGPADLVTGDTTHYNSGTYADGRFAFYLKGSTKKGLNVTASADTGEGSLGDLFSNFMDKDPRSLFRRLDQDYEGYVYPTFGDDSTTTEDAPTQGKFYLKAKKDNNFGMWGNFRAAWMDTDLAIVNRGLYGAYGHYQSSNLTESGSPRTRADTFVAQPGTMSARDEFRGTGGSLYYLRNLDITQGAENIWVEVRDTDSGLVLKTNQLSSGQDYTIDYIQGRVQLTVPLPSTADSSQLVQSGGSLSGHPVFLVVNYEYAPGVDELDMAAIGLRGSRWVNDQFKLGATYSNEDQQGTPQSLTAIDVTWRKTASSYLKFETASSQGTGGSSYLSVDGGYSFNQIAPSASSTDSAGAQRFEMGGLLSDFIGSGSGRFGIYFQQRDAGFSAPGQNTAKDTSQFGGHYILPIGKFSDFNVKFDSKEETLGLSTQALNLDYGTLVGANWKMTAGIRQDSRDDQSPVVPVTQAEGDRTDAAVRMTYEKDEDWKAYYFAQATLQKSGSRSSNNRVGVGGEYQASDKLGLKGELTGGDFGLGARFGADYKVSDDSSLYSTYSLDNERDVSGLRAMKGNFVTGFRTQTSESMSIYGEERYTHGDVPTGLTHAYGVDLTTENEWRYGAAFEMGSLVDQQTSAAMDRTALSLSAGYTHDTLRYTGAFEYRVDDSSASSRTTYLFKNRLNYQTHDHWRLFGKLNFSNSTSSQGAFYDGQFIETVFGYAFRPVDNDRWNTVMKYTYFYNLPSSDQVSTGGAAADYIQMSQVLALDSQYDLNKRWTVGGKYAYRFGQLSADRANPEFFDSRGQLIAVRADWHVIKKWDLTMEARMRTEIDAQDSRMGFLIGAYHHMGNNLKLGGGYNFSDFSDDLTNMDYSTQGLFINVIGKF